MRRLRTSLVALLLTWSRFAGAQASDSEYVERGPRFLLASAAAPVPVRVDVTRTPVLRQSISLDLNGVLLGDALREISAKAGMQLAFSNTMLPAERTVTFRADRITVAAALTELLIDTQVDVLFSRDGRAVLVRRAEDFQGGTVSGKVTDAKSGKAIPNVSVYLEGTRWRATTGEDGAYRLLDVTPGTYTLTASRIGYAKERKSVTVAAGQDVTADLVLQAAATDLEQVIVTGTVAPTERKAIPTPISVISADDIEQQNLQRVDQAFRGQVPGAIAWDPGAVDFGTSVVVRGASGLTAHSVKTFIDGVEVADPIFVAEVDPTSIDRIEIIRGPQASTLYGAGALDGVMQIFTKRGQLGLARPEVMAKVSAGGIGGFGTQSTALLTDDAISVIGGGEKTSYSLGGSYRHTGEWMPSYHLNDWNISAGGQTSQGPLKLSSSLRYANKAFDFPWDTRFQAYTYYSQPFYTPYHLRQETYGLTASVQATQSWQHTLTLGYDRSNFDREQTQPRFTTPADSFLLAEAYYEAKASVLYHTDVSLRLGPAATAVVTAGINYDSYDYVDSYASGPTHTTGTLNGPLSIVRTPWTNTGYFSQVQLAFGDRLFLTGGLRAERNDNFGAGVGTAWSPRFGLAYVLGLGQATLKLRGSYGESIRAPSPGQREAQSYPGFQILANPALAPERQRGADGGVEVYLGRASLGITYYNQRAIDLIQFITLTSASGQYQNLARVKNEGWELEGRLPLGPLQLAGTYSITNSTVLELPPGYPAGGYQVGDPILGIPHTSAGASVAYSPLPQTRLTVSMTHFGHWTERDWVALYGYYFGGQPYRGSDRAYWIEYPTVTKVAVSVSQMLMKGFTAFARAENLGNNHRYEGNNFNIPTPRSVLVGANVRY